MSRRVLAAVAAALIVPGVVGVGTASADPTKDAECRMFETKPGYECRFGKWVRDFTPPTPGKSCSFGEWAPGQRLNCSGRVWIVKPADPHAEKCTAVGARRVAARGMETCTHGPYGFRWE